MPGPLEPTDPSVSDQEFVVTAYVRDRFGNSDWEYTDYGGSRYWRFEGAENEVWVDSDHDGFWDYGRRDEGYGHWSTFDGFVWRDANGDVVEGSAASSAPQSLTTDQNMPTGFDATDSGWFL